MINPMHTGESRDWCAFVRERLELFLDGELLGSENLAFLTHLKECDECASYWAEDEAVSRRLMVTLGEVTEAGAAPSRGPRPSDRRARPFLALDGARWKRAMVVAACFALIPGAYVLGLRSSAKAPAEPRDAASDALSVLWARGGPLERSSAASNWRAIDRGDVVNFGSEVSAPANADLVIGAGSAGSVAISPASRIRLTRPSSGELLSMDLLAGQAAVDVVDRGFSLRIGTTVVSGWSAACGLSATADDLSGSAVASEVVVTRGSVNVRTVCGSRTVTAGQTIDCNSGTVVARAQALDVDQGAADSPSTNRARVDELESLLDKKDREIEDLHDRVARLEDDIRKSRAAAVTAKNGEETPDSVIREYLQTVELSNHVEIDPPNGFARSALARLNGFGDEAVYVLQEFLVRETSEQKKRAILGLVYGAGTPESIEVLKRATGDVEYEVRRTALRLLTKVDDSRLVDHFLSVHKNDTCPDLRTLAAWGAARLGDESGFNALVSTYYESKGYCERNGALSLILRLDKQPAVAAFMHRILRDWTPADGAMTLRMVVKKIGEMRDVEALTLLRDLSDRQGLPQELKRFIDDVADTLHVD